MRSLGWVLALASVVAAQSPSPHRLRADLRFLSSDLLEGRGAGTRGDLLTAEYLRARFTSLGFKTTFQPVSLMGVETLPTTRIGTFTWLTDIAGLASNRQADNTFQFADVVFAGHGIIAPEFHWDDYGDLVVRGKVVVLIAGEPTSDDPAFFGGANLTPYADAEYKFAEAARHGALAALIIHSPETAGFTWDTVRRNWGSERILAASPVRDIVAPNTPPAMQFEGWVTKAAAAKWLETDIDALTAESDKPAFKARRLEKRLAGRVQTSIRTLSTRNVIAIAPGSDLTNVANEAVLFVAHLDSLGTAKVNGDQIYNGAVDNATGLAAMLEIARLWTEIDPAPARTAIFVATAAEKIGAFGAQAYAATPALPLAATKLAINLNSYLPLGRTRDFIFSGLSESPLWPTIRQTIDRLAIDIKNFPSDTNAETLALTKAGLTALTLRPGLDYSSEPARKATLVDEHNAKVRHTPADKFQEDWDLSGLEQVTRVGLELGLAVANAPVPAKPSAN